MIVVKIGDGLGNQLFNYACGYAAARREGDGLLLDTSECDNSPLRAFMLDKFRIKYDRRESFPNRNVLQKAYKNLRREVKYRVIREREVYLNRGGRYTVDDIDPRVFERKRFRDKYLMGYWQHLSYFEEYLDELREMLVPAYPLDEAVTRLMEELQRAQTCAIHVRGGDLTGPGRGYFEEAIRRMEREKPGASYLVFTNDEKAAKEALSQIGGEVAGRLRYVAELGDFSDLDEFFLMSSCRSQILSNSTFSTWAAYRNVTPGRTVIMPEDALSRRMKLADWIIV